MCSSTELRRLDFIGCDGEGGKRRGGDEGGSGRGGKLKYKKITESTFKIIILNCS